MQDQVDSLNQVAYQKNDYNYEVIITDDYAYPIGTPPDLDTNYFYKNEYHNSFGNWQMHLDWGECLSNEGWIWWPSEQFCTAGDFTGPYDGNWNAVNFDMCPDEQAVENYLSMGLILGQEARENLAGQSTVTHNGDEVTLQLSPTLQSYLQMRKARLQTAVHNRS